jgi:hypothetical protein
VEAGNAETPAEDGFEAIRQLPAQQALDAIRLRLEGLAPAGRQACDHGSSGALGLPSCCSKCQRHAAGAGLQAPSMHQLLYGAPLAAASPGHGMGGARGACKGPAAVLESPKRAGLERKMQLWQLKRSMARNCAVGHS